MIRYLIGDVFDRMADIPDQSVDLIVTSPPFLALRSYLPKDHPDKTKEIGSEPTPAAFLSTLLALTREWRRILAPHGSICVELGDTYSGSGGAGGDYGEGGMREGQPTFKANPGRSVRHQAAGYARSISARAKQDDLPKNGPGWPLPKSLCGIPTLYAWSLAYGHNLLDPDDVIDPWRVRNLIVWHRPNPPVGALGDKVRPATSYITTACVSDRRWFDLDAERQPHADHTLRYPRNADHYNNDGYAVDERGDGGRRDSGPDNPAGAPPLDCWIDGDVWTIPTSPYKGAHYATYPPALPRRLIRLMCPMHVCTTCGEPRRRIVETEKVGSRIHAITASDRSDRQDWNAERAVDVERTTLGWSDCECDTDRMDPQFSEKYRRGHVLDPFAGSGTTGQAAIEQGREATLIDIDARNVDLARERVGLFLDADSAARY